MPVTVVSVPGGAVVGQTGTGVVGPSGGGGGGPAAGGRPSGLSVAAAAPSPEAEAASQPSGASAAAPTVGLFAEELVDLEAAVNAAPSNCSVSCLHFNTSTSRWEELRTFQTEETVDIETSLSSAPGQQGVGCQAYNATTRSWQDLKNSTGGVTLYGAGGGAAQSIDAQRVQQFTALVCLNSTIAAQQVGQAVLLGRGGGGEAGAAVTALLNSTCPPGTNLTVAGAAATYDSMITLLISNNPLNTTAVVQSFLNDLVLAADGAGIPACAAVAAVVRKGPRFQVYQYTFWTAGASGYGP
ncbi:hypothetical protein ABPG75_013678 [Micractinium tetrahymenae]